MSCHLNSSLTSFQMFCFHPSNYRTKLKVMQWEWVPLHSAHTLHRYEFFLPFFGIYWKISANLFVSKSNSVANILSLFAPSFYFYSACPQFSIQTDSAQMKLQLQKFLITSHIVFCSGSQWLDSMCFCWRCCCCYYFDANKVEPYSKLDKHTIRIELNNSLTIIPIFIIIYPTIECSCHLFSRFIFLCPTNMRKSNNNNNNNTSLIKTSQHSTIFMIWIIFFSFFKR